MMRRPIILIFVFLCSLMSGPVREPQAGPYGAFPTGLLQPEKKYPYYLFVPAEYTQEKTWPLLILLGKRGENPKETIGPWVEWAKKHQFFLLAPPHLATEAEAPSSADQWLREVKQEVGERYRIDPAQTLLAGFESGAHYAAYLGLNYPKEFPAVVLVRGGGPGPYERLTKPSADSQKEISLYLALDPQEREEFSRAEQWALGLEEKGYRVTFDPLKAGEDFSKFQERLLNWSRKDWEARTQLRRKPRTKLKQKISGFVEDLFKT